MMNELIEFGPTRKGTGKAQCDTPMVTISRNGQVTINVRAVKLTGLKGGDNILLCQDVKKKTNWFIKKVKADGFVLRNVKDKESLIFQGRSLTEKMLISLHSDITVKLPIGEEPIEGVYWPIQNE